MTRRHATSPTPADPINHEELTQGGPPLLGTSAAQYNSDNDDYHTVDEELQANEGKMHIEDEDMFGEEYSNVLKEMEERTQEEDPFQTRPTDGRSRLFHPRTPVDIRLRYSASEEPEEPLVNLEALTPLRSFRDIGTTEERSNAYPSLPMKNSDASFIPRDHLSDTHRKSPRSTIEDVYGGGKKLQNKGKQPESPF